jgi:hypothetical protein
MVVTVATTVYFRAGRTEQFAILLDQAETYAQQLPIKQTHSCKNKPGRA